MNKILFLFLVTVDAFGLTACARQRFQQPAHPSSSKRTDEEHAIYRTILLEMRERIIYNQTIASTAMPGPCPLDSESYPKLDLDLIEDYNQVLQESVPLIPDLLGESVTLLGNYEEWPGMFIQGFSRVGFNKQMDEALVYHESKAPLGALAGGGVLVYLVKGNNEIWKVEWDQTVWIS
jgi:hypothetical protein